MQIVLYLLTHTHTKKQSNYNHGVSLSVITYICMFIVTMCIRNKSKLGNGMDGGVEVVSFAIIQLLLVKFNIRAIIFIQECYNLRYQYLGTNEAFIRQQQQQHCFFLSFYVMLLCQFCI